MTDTARCPLTEGERWTRAELRALRAARFSPRSVGRFLVASQQRAGDVRRARPDLARQEAAWLAAGTAALVVAGPRGARPLAWWGTCALMLDWHLGMVESETGEPRTLGPADGLTLLRAWLVPRAARDAAPAVLLLGWATDVLDGPIARARVPTRAGRDLEGLVDACFAAAAVRGVVADGRLPRGVAALEVARLATGTAYATAVWFGAAQAPDRTVLGAARALTAARAAGVLAAALGHRTAGAWTLGAASAASVAAVVRARRRGGTA